jgi:predicted phosphodiesterase
MAKLSILCTADLHLGRSSACLIRPEGVDVSAVGAWRRIVDRAISGSADAVVIAGDVFDSSGSFYETREAFRDGLRRLEAEEIPVLAVTGNHDYEALRRFGSFYKSPHFHLLGLQGWEAKVVQTKSGPVRFVGWSFSDAKETRSRLQELQALDSEYINLGLVHGDIATGSPYHPLEIAELNRLADSWTLGHVHAPGIAAAKWAYPGSPQALDFGPGERDRHGIRWITAGDRGPTISDVEPISTVFFAETVLEAELAQDQRPWDAALEAAESYVNRVLAAHPGVESVQIRAQVNFPCGIALPGLEERAEPLGDGTHAVLFTHFSSEAPVDLTAYLASPTYLGELANLLVGSAGPQFEAILQECTAEVARNYASIIGAVQDAGDSERRFLEPAEARAQAEQLLRVGMLEMVSKVHPQGGVIG